MSDKTVEDFKLRLPNALNNHLNAKPRKVLKNPSSYSVPKYQKIWQCHGQFLALCPCPCLLEDEGMKQSEAEKQAYFLQDAGEIQTSRDPICHSAWKFSKFK